MRTTDFQKSNQQPIPIGRCVACTRVLANARFLGWEVAGEKDSFGVTNPKDGIEMIFDIQCEQVDPHYRVSGSGYVRVNPDLFADAIGWAKTRSQGSVERMQKTLDDAATFQRLPIGGGSIIRPNGAFDNGDYSLAGPGNMTSTRGARSAAEQSPKAP